MRKPDDCRAGFDLASKQKEIGNIEAELGRPEFWQNRARADEKIKQLGELKNLTDRFQKIEAGLKELERNFNPEKFSEVKNQLRQIELERLFGGRYDRQSAIISTYPGAGGEDAEDWAKMLFEMYQRYAAKRQWQTAILDDSPNHRTLEIKGQYAYGYLKNETGVHRLVRVSPFSAKQLRHTSFALVEVLPELPEIEAAKIEIPEKDLKVEFYRSSGPGGQNVNKVETAVRIVHLPTGLTASSQVERSQHQNRDRVLKLLKAKLIQLMEKHQARELSELRTKIKPEWGNQIRSYVLNPYKLVKDHRTNAETTRIDDVLNGDLDKFIEAEIKLG